MTITDTILNNIQKYPLAWMIECPKCGSNVNAKYALALAPTLGVKILPHFYCHCERYQVMNPRPIKISSIQSFLVFYTFSLMILQKMINYVLRQK